MKHGEEKTKLFSNDVYKRNEGESFNESLNILSTLRKKKLKSQNELAERKRSMIKEFEQNRDSRTASGIFRIGHDRIRISKYMAHFDRQ